MSVYDKWQKCDFKKQAGLNIYLNVFIYNYICMTFCNALDLP